MEEITVVTVRKSALIADSVYDYQRLVYPRERFLNCTLTEEKEEIHFAYQTLNYNPFTEIRNEKMENRLSILMDVHKFYEEGETFQFSINPENLYYDFHHRVYIMQRDIYERGTTFQQGEFLQDYKALIGYSLQKKYSYEAYKEGGEALFKKNSILKPLYVATSLEAIQEVLKSLYAELQYQESKKVTVSKAWYEKSKKTLLLLLLCLLGTSGFMGYQLLYIYPYQNAVIAAGDAYLDSDYVATIDALKKVPIRRLELSQKYILAISYVKSENLTDEQRNNILAGISLRSSEKLLEYWIYMGRLDVSEAQNIAIQISDNQLLLYAYLKQKQLIETNTQISGEEKISALAALESKIKPLADKFVDEDNSIDEDDNTTDDDLGDDDGLHFDTEPE